MKSTDYDPKLRECLREWNDKTKRKIIVLDDDPTGVQTVQDIEVLTEWNKDLLREAFRQPHAVFYILTNTRSFAAEETERINREIARNVVEVAKEENTDFEFISRSDSTLRGHYPLEIDVLADEVFLQTGRTYDGHLIIPAFFEGGRITRDNIHFVKDGEKLIPANETEFAKDPAFGFTHAHLGQWVEEKSEGRFRKGDCVYVSLEQMQQGAEAVQGILTEITRNKPVIINATSYEDLDVLSLALKRVEEKGKRFLFRTAASFVKSYGGIGVQPFLSKERMLTLGTETHGGLIIVGSHVQKTTRQLQALLDGKQVSPVEMNVEKILNQMQRDQEVGRLIDQVNKLIKDGQDTVLYSSRKLITASSKEDNLSISQKVSTALTDIVQALQIAPKFIIAKGGITSSDVATKGLSIRKAKILGQAAAGIPVWLTGEEAKFPNVPYIVFPGNVGTDQTLREIVQTLSGK
ncbi:four-carbon acid sugar kinase family protein [Ammoniphilus resinae]|uniref:Uncharacterized protein YgbK (DUF1537 family) n=1 Tax=Ammoniphilus resinae TaxID=861532 RepID=A0ABS4GU68_9BACL|nr:four-carbon acid sugar kinase family protein [Ammoniphilus resinae]MBP1933803.1 uncharacterized protein YgbK (DUF1537 family) [Ammoniphilus resinae]